MISKNIADRLQEVFIDGTWVANTNYKHILQDVDMEMALYQVDNLNTIAALTYHINYYLQGLIPVFDGGDLTISDKYSFDLPDITSEDEWQKMVQELLSNAETFINKVRQLNPDQLSAPFVEPKYGNYYRNIECVIEHSYYHLGQISLIKKMISNRRTR